MSRCANCQAPADATCRGIRVRRFCALTDPTNPAYRPEYVRILVQDDASANGVEPGLLQQAGNLAGAVGRVVSAVVHGEKIRVSPEERDRRWALCMTCPNLVNDRCKLCGCSFRAKIELATERCPIGKWEKVDLAGDKPAGGP